MLNENTSKTSASAEVILNVSNLETSFVIGGERFSAVRGVSFDLKRGKILAVVGESGSGKSVTGFSIIGMIAAPGEVTGGKVIFKGEDLRQASGERLRQIRGNEIAMVFQDPMMTLNPVLRIDTQMVEAIRAHQRMSKADALARARQALVKVGIADPDARLTDYPHQLSGGMRQRVVIAIALLNNPEVIIADEPTTALDVTIQGQILHEMQNLVDETNSALVWITHDLSVVAEMADEVAVMYAGRVVESGLIHNVLTRPSHPYTRGLLKSVPTQLHRGSTLHQIPGSTPSLNRMPPGCPFKARCERSDASCDVLPDVTRISNEHQVLCHHAYDEEIEL